MNFFILIMLILCLIGLIDKILNNKLGLVAAFDKELNDIGFTNVQTVSYPGSAQKLFIVGDTLLSVGDKTQLEVEGANGKITWTSSDAAKASVSTSGEVTALVAGSTVIKAVESDTSNEGSITITVI